MWGLLQLVLLLVETTLASAWLVLSFPVAYRFLAIEDVNEDKVQDVVFAFKASNSSSSSFNSSCVDEGSWSRSRNPHGRRAGLSLLVLISEAAMGPREETELAGWGEERGECQLLGGRCW